MLTVGIPSTSPHYYHPLDRQQKFNTKKKQPKLISYSCYHYDINIHRGNVMSASKNFQQYLPDRRIGYKYPHTFGAFRLFFLSFFPTRRMLSTFCLKFVWRTCKLYGNVCPFVHSSSFFFNPALDAGNSRKCFWNIVHFSIWVCGAVLWWWCGNNGFWMLVMVVWMNLDVVVL